MWNCLKHNSFGHSSCNQESWAVCCSPYEATDTRNSWSGNAKHDQTQRKKLPGWSCLLSLEEPVSCAVPSPAKLQHQRTGCRISELSMMPKQGTGMWRGGHSTCCFCYIPPTARTTRDKAELAAPGAEAPTDAEDTQDLAQGSKSKL